jgi:hypothetical protein
MPCGTEKLTLQQQTKKKKALKDLEAQIEAGKVTVKRTGDKVQFVGWVTDRENPGHWHDDCAYRTLSAEGSAALRRALARGQGQAQRGRQAQRGTA